MLERREFVGNVLATAVSICAFSMISTKSFSLEDRVRQQLDSEFLEAIHRVASVRETNRSTGLDVTPQFSKILENHSLPDFQTYLAMRFRLIRATAGVGNEEFTRLDDKTLKELDKRFLTYDRLTIGFRYSSDWKDIIEFRASLGNLRD